MQALIDIYKMLILISCFDFGNTFHRSQGSTCSCTDGFCTGCSRASPPPYEYHQNPKPISCPEKQHAY